MEFFTGLDPGLETEALNKSKY